MNRRERKAEGKILARLEKGTAAPVDLLKDCHLGPRKAGAALQRLDRDALVYWTGDAWAITPEGVTELWAIWFRRDWLVCPGCMRLKVSPAHWALRMIGWCDGRGTVG